MTIDLDTLEFRAVVATPGPWKTVDARAMSIYDEIRGADGERIATTYSTRNPFDQAEANAAFIAAANPTVVLELIVAIHKRDKAMQRLARALQWTKETPTEPGWYWWRPEKNIVPHMVYVVWESTMRSVQKDRMFVLYPHSDVEFTVDERPGEWAGPIPYPQEAK